MNPAPRLFTVALLVTVLAVLVPFSCVSCSAPPRDPPGVSREPIFIPENRPDRQMEVGEEDDANFLAIVFYKLKDTHYKGYNLRYEDLANNALSAIAEELKVRGLEFVPEKIEGSVYNHEIHEVFKREFHRAEELSKDSGLVEHELIFLATDAALDAMHETHTYFRYPPDFVGRGRIGDGSKKVYGIGAYIRKYKEEFFFVDKVVPGGAAAKTGIKRFDRITKVNGEPAGDNLNDLISRVRGPDGTVVDVTVERAGAEMKFTMVRGELGELTADGEMVEEDTKRWSYVRFHGFDEVAIWKIGSLNHDPGIFGTTVDGTVLDLRGNPGGYIFVLEQFLSYFLEKGSIPFITDGKDGKDLHVMMLEPLYHGKLVVLVDENSFSAAEMFASAIQTNGRGTIVGVKTTGAVAAGRPVSLWYGASMLVTVERVLDSNGVDLEYVGVTPDVVVEVTKEDILAGRDAQLEKAWEILKKEEK